MAWSAILHGLVWGWLASSIGSRLSALSLAYALSLAGIAAGSGFLAAGVPGLAWAAAGIGLGWFLHRAFREAIREKGRAG